MLGKNTILSPIQTWQDFNPVAKDTEISIVSYTVKDNVLTRELMFTVDDREDGKIRAYLKIANRIDAKENAPVILIIPGIKYSIEGDIFDDVINEGLIYATFDYAGLGEKHTEYPNSVYYGNIEAVKNIIDVSNGSKNTCWYLWDMVARRAITVLCEQLIKPKICVIGVNLGANIGWQVAGMDGRVDCFVAINGCGYIEDMKEYFKPVECKDYPTAWLAGVAPQAYAKYVTCPILYVGGSNNEHSNFDKVQEILGLASSENKYSVICHNSENKITKDAYHTIKLWLGKFYIGDGKTIKDSDLSFNNSDGRLYLNIKTYDEDIEKIEIFVSYSEENSSIREWSAINNYTALDSGEYVVPIDIENVDSKVYCYCNTCLKNGMVLTSKLLCVTPSEKEISPSSVIQKLPTRIVYNTSMHDCTFYGENNSFIFDRDLIVKKQGAFGIMGLGLEGGGSLYTFKVGDKKYRTLEATLQMDAFATVDTTIEVVLYNLENDSLVPYRVSVLLNQCNDRWQQITLNVSDFKNYEMISLETFEDIKKIELKDIGSVIFNNIIWV